MHNQHIAAVIKRQHGLITRRQALEAGFSERQIDLRLAKGEWDRTHQGVYRPAVVKPTWETNLLAATLNTRGVASHRCAAALWNLAFYKTPRTEILVPSTTRPLVRGARVHRTEQWLKRTETSKRGIPVTGVERTVLDCGAVCSEDVLERICESAIRQGLTTSARLWTCLEATLQEGETAAGPYVASSRLARQRRR